MTPDIIYLYSFGFSLAVISLTSWLSAAIESRMKRDTGLTNSNTGLIPTSSTGQRAELRPVEIGYMLRGGDTNHAVLVMGVDLLQRAAKLQLGAAIPEPAEYEKKMWTLAKETAKDWAMKKADPYLPPDFKTNPVGFVKRIYDLYQFITKSLKLVVKDIIADPRQLKRYFSMAGVMRLLADFISAGYQNAFATSLRDYLVANNYLVSEAQRHQAAAKMGLVGISVFPLVFLFSLVIVGNSPGVPLMLFAAAVMTGSAIISSFFITGIFAVREFLPYLTEFETLAVVLNRDSWRLRVLQTARKAMMVALTLVALGASTVVFIAGFVWLNVFGFQNAQTLILVSVFLAFPCLKAFLFLLRSWKLKNTQIATEYGEKRLAEARKRLSEKRPITALTEVLKEEDYNPIFSELMALYGIEALILLA
ncbi:MAG TPA: hypothetical protein EYN91_08120 [Candidatus Melainabacteria bacterium]|nr:hypothetical protein [Candidatus Melainabacteria bacterium]HIN66799.1 hypothetical protein [Candidatus Obscuribacterales bacterium]